MLEQERNDGAEIRRTFSVASSPAPRHWSPAALALSVLAVTTILFVGLTAFTGIAAWHWIERNAFHAGLQDAGTTTVNRTELLKQVRAFEMVSVRQTYAARTQQSVGQTFNAGARQVALPSWLAGEQIDVQGQVQVMAGVDLAQVGPDDIQVDRKGKDLDVKIALPEAQVLETALVPNTLKVSSRAGVLTQLGQALGVSDEHLRDRAADDLVQAGREAAIQQGIEAIAAREGQARLQTFLQKLPQSGGHITYVVAAQHAAGEQTGSRPSIHSSPHGFSAAV